MSIAQRVKMIRETINLSQAEFSKRINVGRSTLAQFELEERNIKDIHIKQICNEFNINEDWLRDGIGEMFKEPQTNMIEELVREFNLDDLDQAIIMEYAKLSSEHRGAVKTFINNLIENRKEKDMVSLPIVARGHGKTELKMTREQLEQFREETRNAPNAADDPDLL